jgi:hypothetical protein
MWIARSRLSLYEADEPRKVEKVRGQTTSIPVTLMMPNFCWLKNSLAGAGISGR